MPTLHPFLAFLFAPFLQGDATETLRRTLSEGVAPGTGTAELCILSGANHMAFCSPVDPCCAAARTDKPLKLPPGTDADALVCAGLEPSAVAVAARTELWLRLTHDRAAPQRALLSVLIVDFLHAHGLAKVCLHRPNS